MPIATANLQQGELIGMPAGRWIRQGDGRYTRQDTIRVSWVSAIDRREQELHALPEYSAAVAFLQGNEQWARQFDNLVGTSYMRVRLDLAQFLDGCLGEALTAGHEGRDPLAAAAAEASSIEGFLNARDVTVETFAPLLGFNSFGLGSVRLTPDLSVEPIDEAELERLFTVGSLAPTSPRLRFFAPPSHIVRFTHRTPKGIGEVDVSSRPLTVDDPTQVANEALDDLVAHLRVFKPGLIAVGGKASTMPPPGGGYQVHGGSSGDHLLGWRMGPFLPNAYVLGESEVPELQRFWQKVHSPRYRESRQLALAVRRFAYKGERTRVDDQLVDLIVAAEALFLGDDESGGELRFRLSTRAACYIRDPTRSRRSVYGLFMAAYRVRSRLLHGHEAKPINVAGEELTPARVVEAVEELLRLALKQAIDEAAAGSTAWAADWEGLLFPEPPNPL